MNRKSFIVTTVFSISAILFLTICLCHAEQGKDESEFRAIVTEANFLFSSIGMEQEQPRLDALITRLRQFNIDFPMSVYADDTAYILTSFWMYAPEKYLQESRAFLEKYPKASLESLTLNTLQILNPFVKEVGVIDAVKTNVSQTLHDLKRYEESAKEARGAIDDLNTKVLSERGYRLLGLNYFYLMKDYEAQAKNEQVRRVCNEAIEKLPNAKDKESFVKKLKELDSVSK